MVSVDGVCCIDGAVDVVVLSSVVVMVAALVVFALVLDVGAS